MVFDESKLQELRGKGADFKESFDMGGCSAPNWKLKKLTSRE